MIEIISANHAVTNFQHSLQGRDVFVLFKINRFGQNFYVYELNHSLYFDSEEKLGIYASGDTITIDNYEIDRKLDEKVSNHYLYNRDEIIKQVTISLREDIYVGIVDLFKAQLQRFTQKQQEQFFDELKDL
jgi:hypothetical protein